MERRDEGEVVPNPIFPLFPDTRRKGVDVP
jgi:hypothetical protein